MHVLDDLTTRLERALSALDQLIEENAREGENVSEAIRLRGKREGVQLALSYVREYERV